MVTSTVVVNAVNITGHSSSSSLPYNSVIRWYCDFLEFTGGLEGQSVFSGVTESHAIWRFCSCVFEGSDFVDCDIVSLG